MFFPLMAYTKNLAAQNAQGELLWLGDTGASGNAIAIQVNGKTFYVNNPSPGSAVTTPQQFVNFWNKSVSGSEKVRPGGLRALPLRQFDVSLTNQGFSNLGIAPTCTGSNPFLQNLQRILVGTSIGTIQVYDVKNNKSLATTSLSAFHKISKGRVEFCVVREIYNIVWFKKRWFVATDAGLFWTP